jgi:hypothetical protein
MYPPEKEPERMRRAMYGRRVAAVLRSMTKDELYRDFSARGLDKAMTKTQMLRHLSRLGWSRAAYA